MSPFVGRLKAVAVEVISDVHPCAGIGVLPPRASDAGILLDDRERDAGFLEPNSGQQAGFAGPDDDDGKLASCGHRERWAGSSVAPVELHLLEHHRNVFLWHRLADQPLHHLVEQFGADRSGVGTSTVAVVADDVQRDLADGGLVLFGHVALHLVQEQSGWLEGAADQLGVAGHVHQRQHQRRNADVEQSLGDLVVRRCKGLAGMWVAHQSVLSRARAPAQANPNFAEMGIPGGGTPK